MLDRRNFLTVCSQAGVAATLLPAVLWAMAAERSKVTREMLTLGVSQAGLKRKFPWFNRYRRLRSDV